MFICLYKQILLGSVKVVSCTVRRFEKKGNFVPSLTIEELTEIVNAVFLNSEISESNAQEVAEALVMAESDGLESHGLARVESYAAQAISKKVDGFAVPNFKKIGNGGIQVDANQGFAYPAINLGLKTAVEAVDTAGIVGLSIKNSHHAGVLGHHVEYIANAGYMGLGFTNSPSALPPWGGKKAIFGTNPIAFSCPRPGLLPLIVDLSLTRVARGKIVLAANNERKIPEGWALDSDGNPTTDAKAALEGSLLPIGGPKGAALALIVEMLTASLSGSHFGFEATSFFTPDGQPPNIGQYFLIINGSMFGGKTFPARVETLIEAILKQSGTRLPGSRRFASRDKAKKNGIEVSESYLSKFRQWSKPYEG